MQQVIVPISDVTGYLASTLKSWPYVPDDVESLNARRFNALIVKAAQQYTKSRIEYLVRPTIHVDPDKHLLASIGFIDETTASDFIDTLATELDDHLTNMALFFDSCVDHVVNILKGHQYIVDTNGESLVIYIGESRQKAIVASLRQKLKEKTVPKAPETPNDLKALDDMAIYIDRTVREILEASGSVEVRDEIKRLLRVSIERY